MVGHYAFVLKLSVYYHLSFYSVSQTVGLETDGNPEDVICKDNISMIFTALLAALKDYSTDQRGDVGAW